MRLPAALRPGCVQIRKRLPWTAAAAAVAHGLRMAVNLAIIKMIAVVLGPSGLGMIGNLLSVLSVVMVFAGGGMANGIAKYVAEHRSRPRAMIRLLETAFALGFAVSAVVFVASIVAARPIAIAVFGNADLWWLVPLLGIAHFASFLGSATIAIVNGSHRPDLFAAISIASYLGCIPAALIFIHLLAFKGAVMALMLMAGCTGIPALWLLLRAPVKRLMRLRFHRSETWQLLRFSMMMATSALAFPTAEIIVRGAVTDQLGLDTTGIWQASIRLSGAIIGFFSVFLLTGFMPRLSALKDPALAIRQVQRSLTQIAAVFAPIAVVIYLLRETTVHFMFSNKFEALAPLLGWQLTGDFFRICAYTIAILSLAKANLKFYIISEIFQYTLYASISIYIVNSGGDLADLVRGYTSCYFIYFTLCMTFLFLYRRQLK